MAYNLKKISEKTSVKPYEKMLIDEREKSGLGTDDTAVGCEKMLEETRKNLDGDEITEKQLNKINEKTAQVITEKQLNDRKSFIPHRNNLGIPLADMSKKNVIKNENEFEKENKKEDKDTEFWDKYVGTQIDEDQITEITPNDQPSQLLSNYESREDFRKENPSMKAAEAVKNVKDADAMLYHIYRTASEEKRDLNKKENTMVSDINAKKVSLLMEVSEWQKLAEIKEAACMEHECSKCNHFWANNKNETKCPECGCEKVSNTFDEPTESDNDKACM